MSSRYKVPYIVGPDPIKGHLQWPPVEDPAFSTILAGGTGIFGQPKMSEIYWAIRRATPEQVRAMAWRVAEWTITGTWGFTDDEYTDNTHTTFLGTISVDNSFDGINPPPKATFATTDNSLTNWTVPLVDEPRLVSESFGPSKFGSGRQYIHDFPVSALCSLHSFGCSTLRNSAGDSASPMTSIVNGVTYDTAAAGDIVVELFRDYGSSATFSAWRGCDLTRYHPLGDGPSGPSGAPSPIAFDVFFLVNSNPGGAINYGQLATFYLVSGPSPLPPTLTPLPPNATITIDPVITPSFTVDAVVGSAGYTNSVYLGSTSFIRTSEYCDVKLTATKFFEYCDSNGDPIWDETTGVQLRDPFG